MRTQSGICIKWNERDIFIIVVVVVAAFFNCFCLEIYMCVFRTLAHLSHLVDASYYRIIRAIVLVQYIISRVTGNTY